MDSIHNQDELATPIVDSPEGVRIKLASKNDAIPTRWLSQIVPQWDDGKNDYDVWRQPKIVWALRGPFLFVYTF